MPNKILIKTSVLPASKKEVFSRLTELKTLQHIAAPYATFTPENQNNDLVWEENAIFSFRFKLFSLLSLGTHTIKVISFSENVIFIPVSKILMCLHGIIELYSNNLIKVLHSIQMKWKLELDGKHHLYICGRRLFTLIGNENGWNFYRVMRSENAIYWSNFGSPHWTNMNKKDRNLNLDSCPLLYQ